jgi:hypothetical protein
MTFLFLTFLAVALTVTTIGIFLSYRAQTGNESAAYYTQRGGYRIAEPLRARTRAVYRAAAPAYSRQFVKSTNTRVPVFLGRQGSGSTPWTAIILGLIFIIISGFYLLLHLLPSHAFIGFIPFYSDTSTTSSNQNSPQPTYGAAKALVRIGQLDPSQYATSAQYNTWAYSACSTAAMTEVINAYGHHYRIADILKVESSLGEITPALGLLEDTGIQRTVAQFGFKTTWGYNLSLNQIIDIANLGRPVIVSFPPSRYAGGHLVVVTGGNANYVYLADSSFYDRHVLTRAQFMQWWGGFSAIVTPQ